jgi:hypothetical protein
VCFSHNDYRLFWCVNRRRKPDILTTISWQTLLRWRLIHLQIFKGCRFGTRNDDRFYSMRLLTLLTRYMNNNLLTSIALTTFYSVTNLLYLCVCIGNRWSVFQIDPFFKRYSKQFIGLDFCWFVFSFGTVFCWNAGDRFRLVILILMFVYVQIS